jgi:hypothetical protein
MTKLLKAQNGFSLQVSGEELKELEMREGKDYEILKVRKGLYVLMDSHIFEEEFIRKIDEKILGLLENSKIQDRVEEKFEKFLSNIELQRFNELLKAGRVEKFRLSEKYKKAVYKLKEPTASSAKQAKEQAMQGTSRQFQAGKNSGFFLSVRTEQQAKELNEKYWKELKEGRMKGLKDFDNTYYLIDSELLEEKGSQVLEMLEKNKTQSLEEIAAKLGAGKELIRGVCAFLKESGEIMEKKKGNYTFIP